MTHPFRFVLAVPVVWVCWAARASAMGGEHPATRPIGNLHADWPAALPAVINSPGRVAGHWVNANDEFFYRGDNKAFSQFVRHLAETKLPVSLVLHTAPQRRSVLWGDEPTVPYDWTLLVGAAGWTSPEWKLEFADPKKGYAARVDAWVDGGLTDDGIDVPTNVRLSVDRGTVSTTRPAAAATPAAVTAFSPIWNVNGWSKDQLSEAGVAVRPWQHALANEDPPLRWVQVTFDCASIPKEQPVLMTAWFRSTGGRTSTAMRTERTDASDGRVGLTFCIPPEQAESCSVRIEIWSKTPHGHAARGYELSLKRIAELARDRSRGPSSAK